MNYQIRMAKPTDIEEIIQLCSEHASFEKAEFKAKGEAEKLTPVLFGEPPRLYCLIAESDTRDVLGYVTYAPEFSTWDAEFYLHMDCLYLRPQARNQGIGKQFIHAIAKHATSLNCQQIQWQTPIFNEDGIRFYRRIGATAQEKVRFYLDINTMNKTE